MMEAIIGGLLLGTIGSFHCVGMCGPLALSLPVHHLPVAQRLFHILLYHIGRVLTYSLLGFILGLIGRGFYLAGIQQAFSIVMGAGLLIIALSRYLHWKWQIRRIEQWGQWLNTTIGRLLHQPGKQTFLWLGMANGLLPCGMVYMAIFSAMVAGNVTDSTIFMISFGLATIPLMLLLGVLGMRVGIGFRNTLRQWIPMMTILVGLLLIMRGLNLGIPFLSPRLINPIGHAITCH
jgi:uncharacterized protein